MLRRPILTLLAVTCLALTFAACGDDGGDDGGFGGGGFGNNGSNNGSNNGGSGGNNGGSRNNSNDELCQPELPSLCPGESICIDNRCEDAFPRRYKITIESAAIPDRNNGDCWDIGCGAPDPFAVVYINERRVEATSVVDDSFSPRWNESASLTITAGDTLNISLYDEDISENDGIFGCDFGRVTGELVRYGDLSCGDNQAGLTATVSPL